MNLKNSLIVLGVAVVLTAILTWPLLPNVTEFYPDQGDYPLAGSVLWYNADSLKTGRIFHPQQYWQGFQFFPHPYALAFANNSLAPSLIFAPIYWLSDSLPFSVNAYAMLTLILTFVSSFYAINYFVKNKWASMIGAFIFTFNPNTMVRFPQHLDVLGKYFLPLVFLFAYRLLAKPSFKKAWLFFLFFTLNGLTVSYYQIFSMVILPLVALPFFISHLRRKDWGYFINLGKVSLVGIAFLPILLYFNLPYLDFSQKEGAYRPLEAAPFFSARITDYFTAGSDNLIYGNWVKSIQPFRTPLDNRGVLNYEEHTLFLGIIPMVLFFLGIKSFHKSKLKKGFFYLLLTAPLILTFGPYFNGAQSGFPLPFYWLYQLVPLMEGVRSPSRFEFLMFVPFSLICAFGVFHLGGVKAHPRGVLVGAILVLLILENFTIKNFDARSEVLAATRRIGRDNLSFLRDKGVLHLPIFTTDDADVFGKNSAYTNWATQTREKTVNGNTSYLPPDYLGLLASFKDGLNDTSLGILKAMGVKFLVIHKKAFGAKIDKGVVLDNEDIQVVDLSKINSKVPICDTNNLDLKETEGDLIVTNQGDCYVVSPGNKRYQSLGKIHYRMPILIGPKEQITLTKENREVKVE